MKIRISAIALCFAAVLFADGGAVEFRKQDGPLLITVFGAPSPLRAGVGDLSVLVQDTIQTRIVLDAEITLTLSKPGEKEIVVPATHEQATNKLLYAAYPAVDQPGDWRLNVQVRSQNTVASADGVITVLPRQPSIITYCLYFALPPLAILLFLLNQYLKVG